MEHGKVDIAKESRCCRVAVSPWSPLSTDNQAPSMQSDESRELLWKLLAHSLPLTQVDRICSSASLACLPVHGGKLGSE